MEARLLFIGLWTLADRSGRLEDRPKQIKMDVFPADSVDCDALIDQLAATGMVARYTVGGNRYLQVVNFEKHQNPHRDEKASTLPDQDGHIADAEPTPKKHSASTVQAPCDTDAATVAIGLTPDPRSLIPDSLIPETPTKKDNACRVAPFGVSDAVWDDFLKIRRANKSPMTNTALAGIQREAEKAGVTLEAALKTCCERGWRSYKADWTLSKTAAVETVYQKSMRLRVAEFAPDLARKAPGERQNPTEFFRTIEAKTLEISQ